MWFHHSCHGRDRNSTSAEWVQVPFHHGKVCRMQMEVTSSWFCLQNEAMLYFSWSKEALVWGKKMHCAWCLMLVLCPSMIPAGNRAYLLSGSCLIVFLPEATCLLVGQLGAIFFEHQFWTGSGLLWQDPDADTVFLLQNVNTAPMPLGCTSGISMDHGFTWGPQPENPGIDPFFRRHR